LRTISNMLYTSKLYMFKYTGKLYTVFISCTFIINNTIGST